ncbi:MAG: hypothetical protein HYS17_02375 [Micavibrio aeruginosavorus]|uniref:Uncharacterized protein n=1 Tax=Micavibrio aeruginosavorus TaxID=349221 RepID=A0A7T5R383_9BACT|nr:MAG: hypothetical protein HYS17_02375 [Micavibrio aeruginosavorus]
MTTEIYVQTTPNITFHPLQFLPPVSLPFGRHMAIWIVRDGETIILNAYASEHKNIEVPNPLSEEWGNLVVEKFVVEDIPTNQTIEDMNLNKLNLTDVEAATAASAILSYYNNLGQLLDIEGRHIIDTGLGYAPVDGPNSNSIANSFLTLMNVDYNTLDLYEDGDSSEWHYAVWDHTAHDHAVDAAGNHTLQGFNGGEIRRLYTPYTDFSYYGFFTV